MKHQRTLYQKLVSKEKAKAKSPPIVDDSASNVSVDSHVSIPVVILPIDSQSVDVNDNIDNLFRQNTYLQNKKHMLTCQRWDWLL